MKSNENYKVLGNYIETVDSRNKDLKITNLLGVSITKQFIPSIANIVGTDLSSYKVVRTGQFAYGPVTSRNGEKISIALLNSDNCIISSSYTVFQIKNTSKLDNEYLMLWFSRPEFDRYARYKSHGSVREIFSWEEMLLVELPIPSIDKQREIVNVYKAITDRIALKQQINDNLAAEINTIYYRWFNEFLSPYASSERYSNEFGDLPIGWKITELGDYIESFSKTHSFDNESLVFLNTSDILAGDFLCNTYMTVAEMPGQAKKQIAQGDILFSEIRPANKRYALVTFPADDYVVSTKLMVLRTTQSELSNLRIYHYLTMEKTLDELHREADGKSGTFPQITFDENLRYRKFIVADERTEKHFDKLLAAYFELEDKTRKEIKSLNDALSTILTSLSR